jgi:hypothetical protein
MICYICLSMGSHEHLRKFRLTLNLTSGVPKVVFKRMRDSVGDTEIDIEETINEETLESSSSINFEIQRLTRG